MRKSFTFLEILISALILAVAVGGLLSSFVASRKIVRDSQTRLRTANLERRALARLYAKVVQGKPFTCQGNCTDLISVPPGYTCTCTIKAGPPKQATIKIDYPQPQE